MIMPHRALVTARAEPASPPVASLLSCTFEGGIALQALTAASGGGLQELAGASDKACVVIRANKMAAAPAAASAITHS